MPGKSNGEWSVVAKTDQDPYRNWTLGAMCKIRWSYLLISFISRHFAQFVLVGPDPWISSSFFSVSTQRIQAVLPNMLLVSRYLRPLVLSGAGGQAKWWRRGAGVDTSPHLPEKACWALLVGVS